MSTCKFPTSSILSFADSSFAVTRKFQFRSRRIASFSKDSLLSTPKPLFSGKYSELGWKMSSSCSDNFSRADKFQLGRENQRRARSEFPRQMHTLEEGTRKIRSEGVFAKIISPMSESVDFATTSRTRSMSFRVFSTGGKDFPSRISRRHSQDISTIFCFDDSRWHQPRRISSPSATTRPLLLHLITPV